MSNIGFVAHGAVDHHHAIAVSPPNALSVDDVICDPRGTFRVVTAASVEVGRAAHACNRMQSRLRRFVDGRTAMIGAISHDLRTPLTRCAFVSSIVEDAVFVGNDVRLTLDERAPVEVDAIGTRRLLSTLVANAVKYGTTHGCACSPTASTP